MKRAACRIFLVLLLPCLMAFKAGADTCSVCGKTIEGPIYLVTDMVTGDKEEVCSNCVRLPRCYICGRPVGADGIELADGRRLCPRDAKTVVLDPAAAKQIATEVENKLDHLFSRFMTFPSNVKISVLDRISVDKLAHRDGFDLESPNILGCIRVDKDAEPREYSMRLLTGLPAIQLESTAAHEFSHAWVNENVPAKRHLQLSHDAEEGFCELMAYLLMNSEDKKSQMQYILHNYYTRGQINLFVDAEQKYGLNDVLDWMRYGQTSALEANHLDEVRDVKMPHPAKTSASQSLVSTKPRVMSTPIVASKPKTLELQGIFWGSAPSAIINGQTFLEGDEFNLKIGDENKLVRCLKIQKDSVQIEEVGSSKHTELKL